MEDDLRWRTTFDCRRHLMEDDNQWKLAFQSKTTFNEKRHFMEDDLDWKMTSFEEFLRLRS